MQTQSYDVKVNGDWTEECYEERKEKKKNFNVYPPLNLVRTR